MSSNRIAVLGDGGWGTTLAIVLHRRGIPCVLWGVFPEYVEVLKKSRENKKFLPGVSIPKDLAITSDISQAMADTDVAVLAIPSQHMRSVCQRLKGFTSPSIWLSVAKGIENGSLCRMSEVVEQELGTKKVCVLSGPSHAEEVVRGIPTSAVIASRKEGIARRAQEIFNGETMRLYTSSDVVGVELGGSLKNVMAIAVGISDGLGYGDNTKAALMTRGLEELTRLGIALGAKRETFAGLSGMGDLITTCISRHSRNRNFGERMGKGMMREEALRQNEMVVEGVLTTQSAYALAKKVGVEVPIISEIQAVLYESKDPKQAVRDLLKRQPTTEIKR